MVYGPLTLFCITSEYIYIVLFAVNFLIPITLPSRSIDMLVFTFLL